MTETAVHQLLEALCSRGYASVASLPSPMAPTIPSLGRGVVELLAIDRTPGRPRTYHEIEDIDRLLSGAGVSFVLLGYPYRPDFFEGVNAEIARAGDELGVPLILLPPEERRFVTELHPGPAVYRKIARELALLISDL